MADPFPAASTPGIYATYPGRVVPDSIPDRVAPDLESAYHRLAPDLDAWYGSLLPFGGFRAIPPWEAIRTGRPPGVSVAESPAVANRFAEPSQRSRLGLSPTSPPPGFPSNPARSPAPGPRVYPLLMRSEKPASLRLSPGDDWGDIWRTVANTFGSGYDAVRLSNYTMFPDLGPQTIWMIRDPAQLRSPFAAFDPARRSSNDLLAGSAVPAPLAAPVSAPEQRAPGFRGPPSLAESLAYWRFMHEPKVY